MLTVQGSNFRLGGIAPITRAVPSFTPFRQYKSSSIFIPGGEPNHRIDWGRVCLSGTISVHSLKTPLQRG